MPNTDGFPVCTSCKLPIRVEHADAPGLCKSCAPARPSLDEQRAVAAKSHADHGGAPAPAATKRRR
jgi:hypothetical protein